MAFSITDHGRWRCYGGSCRCRDDQLNWSNDTISFHLYRFDSGNVWRRHKGTRSIASIDSNFSANVQCVHSSQSRIFCVSLIHCNVVTLPITHIVFVRCPISNNITNYTISFHCRLNIYSIHASEAQAQMHSNIFFSMPLFYFSTWFLFLFYFFQFLYFLFIFSFSDTAGWPRGAHRTELVFRVDDNLSNFLVDQWCCRRPVRRNSMSTNYIRVYVDGCQRSAQCAHVGQLGGKKWKLPYWDCFFIVGIIVIIVSGRCCWCCCCRCLFSIHFFCYIIE